MRKDILASGGRKATFVTGTGVGPADLKNMSSEPRTKDKSFKIDRTRKIRRIVPKGDNILVQRRDSEDISAGGILIPDAVKVADRPAEGIITAVGSEVEDLAVGQHIIFGRYSGTEYPMGGEVLLFMRADEVIAILED